jgi:hypothetical protein
MFEALNAIYLAAILFSSITLYPTDETLAPTQKDSFVEMKFHREYWREDGNGKCAYTGVMVPYTRTWPEEVHRGDEVVVLPPEPDKVAGYVAVVTRKVCKGQEPVAILRAGTTSPRTPFFGSSQFDKTRFFPAGDMIESPVDKIPQWLPQVVERMAMLAQTDPKAKAFIDAARPQLDKALPGLPGLAIARPSSSAAVEVEQPALSPKAPVE